MDGTNIKLSLEQEKAVSNLEKAFKRCKKAGLYFAGVNFDLRVSSYHFHEDAHKFTNSEFPTLTGVPNWIVNTYGAYIDSGGD